MNWYKRAHRGPANVMLSGKLKKGKNGFVYLSLSNDVVHGLFTLLGEDNIEKPPYFGKEDNGAHLSVMSPDEGLGLDIKELNKNFSFELTGVKTVNPAGWDEMDRVWFVEAEADSLKKLRKKYKLPETYNDKGHKFHITFAVRKAKKEK